MDSKQAPIEQTEEVKNETAPRQKPSKEVKGSKTLGFMAESSEVTQNENTETEIF